MDTVFRYFISLFTILFILSAFCVFFSPAFYYAFFAFCAQIIHFYFITKPPCNIQGGLSADFNLFFYLAEDSLK